MKPLAHSPARNKACATRDTVAFHAAKWRKHSSRAMSGGHRAPTNKNSCKVKWHGKSTKDKKRPRRASAAAAESMPTLLLRATQPHCKLR